MKSKRIYYRDQEGWGYSDYYSLFRYLNRMFLNKNGSRDQEIESIDVSLLSEKTRALMVAILAAQKKLYYLDKYQNLSGLKQTRRLQKPLKLTEKPRGIYSEFSAMNIHL